MIEEKEKQIEVYYQITLQLLDALTNGREDVVNSLLNKREEAIKKMDAIDDTEKQIVMNDTIQEQITKLLRMEKQIQEMLFQAMKQHEKHIVSIRNESFLFKHYDQPVIIPNGAFYDKKN
ncbi:hypothetical protein [Ectobacillus sp. sgz5001026]|uniref:hypothetical protein n=1 Tax=Ectobacillus sp. sgz5001026 TaxID=3242473 RepID=UPI0036D312DE